MLDGMADSTTESGELSWRQWLVPQAYYLVLVDQRYEPVDHDVLEAVCQIQAGYFCAEGTSQRTDPQIYDCHMLPLNRPNSASSAPPAVPPTDRHAPPEETSEHFRKGYAYRLERLDGVSAAVASPS